MDKNTQVNLSQFKSIQVNSSPLTFLIDLFENQCPYGPQSCRRGTLRPLEPKMQTLTSGLDLARKSLTQVTACGVASSLVKSSPRMHWEDTPFLPQSRVLPVQGQRGQWDGPPCSPLQRPES